MADLREHDRVTAADTFEEFFEREWVAAVRTAALLTQARSVAEEIAQEAFARVFQRWDRIDRPGAYLQRCVTNGARGDHRHRSVVRDKLPLLLTADDPPESAFVADALAALPFRQRAVLVLRYRNGLSERQIADALACRPGTVKSAHARAIATIGEALR